MPRDYNHFRRAWGRAKTEFLNEEIRKGYSKAQAEENWRAERRRYKLLGVQYPNRQVIERLKQKTQKTHGNEDEAEDLFSGDFSLSEVLDAEETAYLNAAYDDYEKQQRPQSAPTVTKTATKRPPEPDTEEAGPSGVSAPKYPAVEPTNTGDNMATQSLITDFTEATMDTSGGNTGGGPGVVDNMGGGGGGLAGAGNNMFHNGFGGVSEPVDPEAFAYVQTYRRSYTIDTTFPETEDSEIAHEARIAITPGNTWDANATPQLDPWPTKFHDGKFNHMGVMFPYFVREAPMKPHEWNAHIDHHGYKLLEYGFELKNARLSIMNNPKKDATEVAPAPPSDARMWFHVDTTGDYGIPETYESADLQHNNYFTEEEITDPDPNKYSLPLTGTRTILVTPAEFTQLTTNRMWKKTADNKYMLAADPNSLYDIKRHPGYREFILSTTKPHQIGYSYKADLPIVEFPNKDSASLTMSTRGYKGYYTDFYNSSNTTTITMWPSVYAPFRDLQKDTTADAIINGMVHFYNTNITNYSHEIIDTDPISDPQQSLIDIIGKEPLRPPNPTVPAADKTDYGLIDELTHTKRKTKPQVYQSDNGLVRAAAVGRRPPLVQIGVYKEIEYRSSGPLIWRYVLTGQVEYWVKIKWYVQPRSFPVYYPIGPGGIWFNTVVPQDGSRWEELKYKAALRQKKRYLRNTTHSEGVSSYPWY